MKNIRHILRLCMRWFTHPEWASVMLSWFATTVLQLVAAVATFVVTGVDDPADVTNAYVVAWMVALMLALAITVRYVKTH